MPEMNRGRLFDHVHLRTRDLAAAKRFYLAVLEVLGVPAHDEEGHLWADELWIDAGEPHTHVHIAFQAKDQAMVDRFYDAAMAAGGKDNGPPGERKYHPGYYAAFVWDPDGNNVEAVFHGPHQRSVESVVLSF